MKIEERLPSCPPQDPAGLEGIASRIEKLGFDVRQLRPSYLERRLLVRMRATRSTGYNEYRKLLDDDPTEYERLLDALTINLTEFFRDIEVFNFFSEKVVTEILARKAARGHRLIRVWSAGCATGEEPYSIAMLLHHATRYRPEGFAVAVTGTDVDYGALTKAKSGRYEIKRAAKVPERYRRRFLTETSDTVDVIPEVKSLVRFKRLDLFAEESLKMVDVVFCRNVMIYFNRGQQEKLQKTLCDSLLNNGYLILGRSEKLVGEAAELMEPVSVFLRVYRKC